MTDVVGDARAYSDEEVELIRRQPRADGDAAEQIIRSLILTLDAARVTRGRWVDTALLAELDACKPLMNAAGPAQGGNAFSGWEVPHWLMLRVRFALREIKS